MGSTCKQLLLHMVPRLLLMDLEEETRFLLAGKAVLSTLSSPAQPADLSLGGHISFAPHPKL
ncbi:hypothetical protein E2C01_010578 [Portunus trituberculatus]|uniref:Uncharacterized protein n=1 Tax=Portunus trituberculatus TaxID=210409 RepID=A0A5B7D8U9_PORTR|nr:hypothetical protein [Portunus trituberculatus]